MKIFYFVFVNFCVFSFVCFWLYWFVCLFCFVLFCFVCFHFYSSRDSSFYFRSYRQSRRFFFFLFVCLFVFFFLHKKKTKRNKASSRPPSPSDGASLNTYFFLTRTFLQAIRSYAWSLQTRAAQKYTNSAAALQHSSCWYTGLAITWHNGLMIKSVKQISGDQVLEVRWETGNIQFYPYVWLSDNCPCLTVCWDKSGQSPTAGSRFGLDVDVIPYTVEVTGTTPVTSLVAFEWSDGHTNQYLSDWLLKYKIDASPQDPIFTPKLRYWGAANDARKLVKSMILTTSYPATKFCWIGWQIWKSWYCTGCEYSKKARAASPRRR